MKDDTEEIGLYLISYYRRYGRRYPWRHDRSPFHVYLSEILLQRTQADQVELIFNILISRFPNVTNLKENFEEVSTIMKPLGRYCRLDFFRDGLHYLDDYFGGEIPEERERLLEVPGIGPYIAAAVRAFGYGIRDTIIDSNVVRVLGRIYGVNVTPETRRNRLFYEMAERHVPLSEYIDYSYGIFDFAAAVCRAKRPVCCNCGLNKLCHFSDRSGNE